MHPVTDLHRQMCAFTGGPYLHTAMDKALGTLYDALAAEWQAAGALPLPVGNVDCTYNVPPLLAWLMTASAMPPDWYANHGMDGTADLTPEWWALAASFNALMDSLWEFA